MKSFDCLYMAGYTGNKSQGSFLCSSMLLPGSLCVRYEHAWPKDFDTEYTWHVRIYGYSHFCYTISLIPKTTFSLHINSSLSSLTPRSIVALFCSLALLFSLGHLSSVAPLFFYFHPLATMPKPHLNYTNSQITQVIYSSYK